MDEKRALIHAARGTSGFTPAPRKASPPPREESLLSKAFGKPRI